MIREEGDIFYNSRQNVWVRCVISTDMCVWGVHRSQEHQADPRVSNKRHLDSMQQTYFIN